MTIPRPFPDEGCERAFNCGKEFILGGGTPDMLPKVLSSYCETNLEKFWFLRGMNTEILDAVEATA